MRAGDNVVTRRRNVSRLIVWMLSKLTTQLVGTPSVSVSSSSDARPRRVRVRAATTTEPILSATGSRVSTSTGRSPPGVAANHTSPRCIGPIRPVLCRPPVGDVGQGPLTRLQRCFLPPVSVLLGGKTVEVATKRLAKELGSVDAESLRPSLRFGRIVFVDPEAQHRHTAILSMYDTPTQRPQTASEDLGSGFRPSGFVSSRAHGRRHRLGEPGREAPEGAVQGTGWISTSGISRSVLRWYPA